MALADGSARKITFHPALPAAGCMIFLFSGCSSDGDWANFVPQPPATATAAGAAAPAQEKPIVDHMVVQGDSLWVLARRYGTTVHEIQAANGMEGDLIRVGQRLKIPTDAAPPGAGTASAARTPGAPATPSTITPGVGTQVIEQVPERPSDPVESFDFGTKPSDLNVPSVIPE